MHRPPTQLVCTDHRRSERSRQDLVTKTCKEVRLSEEDLRHRVNKPQSPTSNIFWRSSVRLSERTPLVKEGFRELYWQKYGGQDKGHPLLIVSEGPPPPFNGTETRGDPGSRSVRSGCTSIFTLHLPAKVPVGVPDIQVELSDPNVCCHRVSRTGKQDGDPRRFRSTRGPSSTFQTPTKDRGEPIDTCYSVIRGSFCLSSLTSLRLPWVLGTGFRPVETRFPSVTWTEVMLEVCSTLSR